MKYFSSIERALIEFEKIGGLKKGILLLNERVTYLYDNNYCLIDCIKLELKYANKKIIYQTGDNIPEDFFIYFKDNSIKIVTNTDEYSYTTSDNLADFKLAISFKIILDEEDSIRGIAYINNLENSQIYFSYISEDNLADLFEQLIFNRINKEYNLGQQVEDINSKMIYLLNKLHKVNNKDYLPK